VDLLIPQIDIAEGEGFSPEKDIFKRKEFGLILAKQIANSNGNLVIGLDSNWGQGKTTFVKMWQGLLQSSEFEIKSIYFDAFQNDHHNDAFFVIASEIYDSIEPAQAALKDTFKVKAVSAMKAMSKIGIRVGVKALTGVTLGDTILEGQSDEIGAEIAQATNKAISKKFDEVRANKKTIEEFRIFLTGLVKTVGNGKPIVMIIDELDRCRPDFALSIVETIKHFFAIPGLAFVLVMNKEQMQSSIKGKYGIDTKASEYLQKFVHLWATLPTHSRTKASASKIFLRQTLSKMGCNLARAEVETFEQLLDLYNLSLREVERVVTYYALIENSGLRAMYPPALVIAPYLCVIKVKFYDDVYCRLVQRSISFEDIKKKTLLGELPPIASWSGVSESHPLLWILRYNLADNREGFAGDLQKIPYDYEDQQVLNYVLPILEMFKER
jgi:hypothetical protein